MQQKFGYRFFEFSDVRKVSDERFYASENTVVIPHNYPIAEVHSHDFYEVEFFLSGAGKCSINGNTKRFEKGSVMLLVPSSYHSFEFDERPGCNIISMRLDYSYASAFEEIFGDSTGFCIPLPQKILDKICADVEDIYEQKKYIHQPYIEQYASATVRRILSLVAASRGADKDDGKTRDMKMVEVMMYIRKNFRNPLKLSEVATRFGYSANHMGKKIRDVTGKGFSEYLGELRLVYAYTFITQSEKSFKLISIDAGFHSYACFFQAFVKRFGITPSAARRGAEPSGESEKSEN